MSDLRRSAGRGDHAVLVGGPAMVQAGIIFNSID
jgi:hypothetical protein